MVIGPGKALDTDKFFIICSNVLGGCKGSTGPSSINPETNKEYALDFPIITIQDMVHAQKKLIDHLGISNLLAVIGGSMGGMQVLDWMVTYPAMMKKAVPIATTGLSSPQQIAFNEVGRQAIFSDPNWNNGNYYETGKIPENGLSLARMIAHITYLSDESMDIKFGRDLQDKEEISYDFSIDFQVESYLKHQGETFVKRFDANSYLFITKAVDLFDLSVNDSLIDGLKEVECKTEVISVDSDWLYPTEQSTELVTALNVNNVEVSFSEIKSNYGHDAFLLERGQLNHILSKFLSSSTVEDLMMEKIATIKADADVQDAAKLMLDKHVTHIPVVTDENKLIGIVTSWDLSKSIATNSNQLIDIMTTTVKYCHADDTIEEIARQMRKFDISCLPVVDEDMAVLGLITTDQISNLLG
jgi:homoserine O-acetyltransferase